MNQIIFILSVFILLGWDSSHVIKVHGLEVGEPKVTKRRMFIGDPVRKRRVTELSPEEKARREEERLRVEKEKLRIQQEKEAQEALERKKRLKAEEEAKRREVAERHRIKTEIEAAEKASTAKARLKEETEAAAAAAEKRLDVEKDIVSIAQEETRANAEKFAAARDKKNATLDDTDKDQIGESEDEKVETVRETESDVPNPDVVEESQIEIVSETVEEENGALVETKLDEEIVEESQIENVSETVEEETGAPVETKPDEDIGEKKMYLVEGADWDDI
jgi:hypothetical protein